MHRGEPPREPWPMLMQPPVLRRLDVVVRGGRHYAGVVLSSQNGFDDAIDDDDSLHAKRRLSLKE